MSDGCSDSRNLPESPQPITASPTRSSSVDWGDSVDDDGRRGQGKYHAGQGNNEQLCQESQRTGQKRKRSNREVKGNGNVGNGISLSPFLSEAVEGAARRRRKFMPGGWGTDSEESYSNEEGTTSEEEVQIGQSGRYGWITL